MLSDPFLRLDDIVLPAPLPALSALLLVLGIHYLGDCVADWLRGPRTDPLDRAGGYLFVLAVLSVSLLMAGWAGAARFPVLRLLATVLAACGSVQTVRVLRTTRQSARKFGASLMRGDAWERAALLALLLAAGLVFLGTLGPPTDADSLDYHLGAPLQWLRDGGTFPRTDWLTLRLAGAGEALNMLGLAAGTDSLGAVLQASGLVVAVVALYGLARDREGRVLAGLLVLSSPILCVLALTQKPQLLPATAVAASLVLLARRDRDLDTGTTLLASGSLGFAIACRYPFLLPGTVVGLLALWRGYRSGRAVSTFGVGIAVVSALVLPVMAWRMSLYGDPVTPFLEHWKASPDPAVLALKEYLSTYGGARTASRVMRLPLDLTASLEPGRIQRVLGLGTLAFIPALRARGISRLLLLSAAGAAFFAVTFAQLRPRFFAPAYLFAGAAAVAASPGRLRTWLLRVLAVQTLATAGLAAVGAYGLFPGALTEPLRERTMTKYANGYAEARWQERVLPAEAVVLSVNRSRALLPHRFAVYEPLSGDVRLSERYDRLDDIIRRYGVTAAVVSVEPDSVLRELVRCRGTRVAGPARFSYAVRNPLIDLGDYQIHAVSLGPEVDSCGQLFESAAARGRP